MTTAEREHDDLDAVFDALRNRHRRYALHALAESDRRMCLTNLADEVVSRAPSETERSTDAAERVQMSLHHAHLPKLADIGVVEYDVDEKVAELTGDDTIDRFTDDVISYANQ